METAICNALCNHATVLDGSLSPCKPFRCILDAATFMVVIQDAVLSAYPSAHRTEIRRTFSQLARRGSGTVRTTSLVSKTMIICVSISFYYAGHRELIFYQLLAQHDATFI